MVLNSDIPNPRIAFPFIELTSKVSHKITVSRKLIDFMFDKNNYLQLLLSETKVRKPLFLQNMKSKYARSLKGPDPIHFTKTWHLAGSFNWIKKKEIFHLLHMPYCKILQPMQLIQCPINLERNRCTKIK